MILFLSFQVNIVRQGGNTLLFYVNPPFSKIPPLLEIQDVPTFYVLSGKQKYWMILLTNLYVISILKVA